MGPLNAPHRRSEDRGGSRPPGSLCRSVLARAGLRGVAFRGSQGPPGQGPRAGPKSAIFAPLRRRVQGGWGGSAHSPDPTAQSVQRADAATPPVRHRAPGVVRGRQGGGGHGGLRGWGWRLGGAAAQGRPGSSDPPEAIAHFRSPKGTAPCSDREHRRLALLLSRPQPMARPGEVVIRWHAFALRMLTRHRLPTRARHSVATGTLALSTTPMSGRVRVLLVAHDNALCRQV